MKRIAAVVALTSALLTSPADAQQYAVKLSWTASSDASANPSLTYNVYRASSCAGHFALINSAPVTATSYVDPSSAAGAAYCYQVTAVLAGLESAPSNQAIAAVPSPPDRQTICSHRGPVIGWIRCLGSRPRHTNPQSPSQ
jgi:fibronectin type 3 domain-containing protein